MVSPSTSVKGVAAGGGLILLLAVVSVGTAPLARPAQATAPVVDGGSLCAPAEVALFSCEIGAKRAAICGSGGQATYRYGRPGRIELSSAKLTIAERAFSGGGETQVTAVNKDYSYTVFDRTTRTAFGDDGRHDASSGTGLLVRRAGKPVSSRMCDDENPISSNARKIIPTGAFIAH